MKEDKKNKDNSSKVDNFLKKELEKVEKEIITSLTSNVSPKFQEIAKYQIETGGKRIRPILAIASCRIFNKKEKDIIYASSGIEVLHNYSLIIDDIIDNSPIRRGKPTTWNKFGSSIAKCASMYYSASFFDLAVKTKKPTEISKLFVKILKVIVNGEIMDILLEQKGKEEEPFIKQNRKKEIKKEDYLDMISQKTAQLMGFSCQAGGICANATKEEIKNLKNFGLNLGMAFQVSDDILDIFGKKGKFGKEIGKDIEDRKRGNCVIYFAIEEFSLKEKKRFLNILQKKEIKKADLKEAIAMIKKTKAKERAINCGEEFVLKAKKSLSSLPKNIWSKFLEEKVDKIMERTK